MLNGDQFDDAHPYWGAESDEALLAEHKYAHDHLVGSHKVYNPQLKPWPRHETGGSIMQHETIVVHGWNTIQSDVEGEMRRRMLPMPLHNSSTLQRDVDDQHYPFEHHTAYQYEQDRERRRQEPKLKDHPRPWRA